MLQSRGSYGVQYKTTKLLATIIRRTPVTVALTLGVLVLGIIFQTLWSTDAGTLATQHMGYGLPAFLDGTLWSLFAGSFFAAPPWTYLVIVPLLLLVAGYVEHKYGANKLSRELSQLNHRHQP